MFNEQMSLFTLDDENVLEIALSRVASILSVQDILDELEMTDIFPNSTKFIDDMLSIVSSYTAQVLTEINLVKRSILCLYLAHLWYLNRVTKKPDFIEGYITKRDAIVESLSICVALMGDVKDQAFQLLCETLIIVSGQAILVSTIEDYMYSVELKAEEAKAIAPEGAF
jgi:hypothetical protein